MRTKAVVVLVAILALATGAFAASKVKARKNRPTGTLTVLYSFTCTNGDGCYPYGTLMVDKKTGNLWGLTNDGGANSYGTVFELVKTNNYAETVAHSFDYTDGAYPFENSLVEDSSGNIYGETDSGGANGYGTVFEISSSGTFSTLHSFDYSDGGFPYGGPILLKGVLYGTTESGGSNGYGTVWSLTTSGTLTTLENLDYSNTGGYTLAGLTADKKGNLWGTCEAGGTNGYGTIFELTQSKGTWTFNVEHAFDYSDGGYPYGAAVAVSKVNAIIGTTESGGSSGAGTVWQIKNGTFASLYSFTGSTDGGYPFGTPKINKKGQVFGTTEGGGNDYGTVYIMTQKSGTWTETVDYAFSYTDGGYPYGGVVGSATTVFGTTGSGGTNGYGEVFSLAP